MKNILKLFLTLIIFVFAFAKVYAQDDMSPPKPIDNKVYDAMVGEWTGESDMMGMKMTESLKIYWNLNHQFLFTELKMVGKDNSGIKYSGIGIFGIDKSGNAKTWWFDDWGAEAMATGSGTFGDMKLTMQSTNPMYTEERSFEMKDGAMTSSWNSTMKGKDGKDITMIGTTVYKKK